MKAYVVFSSNEPVLVLTRQAIRSTAVLGELRRIGCLKFIAREVSVDQLRSLYGQQFDVIENALRTGSDLRVLDYSGRRIFQSLPLSELGPAYCHESSPTTVGSSRESSRPALRPSLGSASHVLCS